MQKSTPPYQMSVEEATKKFSEEVEISPYGEPEEIADELVYGSPAAKWMTGTSVWMDGGEIRSI